MVHFIDVKTAAERLGISERAVRKKCKAGELGFTQKFKGRWKIPSNGDMKLYRADPSRTSFTAEQCGRIPLSEREEAIRKLGVVQEFQMFAIAHKMRGGLRSDAYVIFAKRKGIGKSTLQRWIKLHRVDGIMGLVDARCLDHNKEDQISEDAFEYFKTCYLGEYQIGIQSSWELTKDKNEFEERGWNIPDYRSMCRIARKRGLRV